MLLQNQRDLVQQHTEATLESDPGADVSALKRTAKAVGQQLDVVMSSLRGKSTNPLDWALAMLGLTKSLTPLEVEEVCQHESHRTDAERRGQLAEAVGVLRAFVAKQTSARDPASSRWSWSGFW
mmetsp:Transcript_31203/g.80915  ORF Transcript_31203/g.80915 Transcript_31203/m.80915 type:complete len:124 (-) Transcript_31203:235-606(-)